MPLDQDAVVWCAPAGAGNECPVDEIEAFLVPKGCILMLRPGVWHHAAYAVEERPLNVMIVLPERAYATDCYCTSLEESKQVALEF